MGAPSLTMMVMRLFTRRRVLAALVVVLGVSSLILAYRHRAMDEVLSREFDLAIQRREAVLAANVMRPVLRGKPMPGDGGHLLKEALGNVRWLADQHPGRPIIIVERVLGGEGTPEDVAAARRILEDFGDSLAEIREALQYESCRIPQDPGQIYWDLITYDDDHAIRLVGGLLRLQAHLEAEQGDLQGAFTTLSDTARLGQDLRRGTPFIIISLLGVSVEASAIHGAFTLLSSSSAGRDELASFLDELSVLDRSWPSYPARLEVWECDITLDFVRCYRGEYPEFDLWADEPFWQRAYGRLRGGYPDFGSRNIPFLRKQYLALVGIDFEGFHRVWDGFREASALPVPEMRERCVPLEVAAEAFEELLLMPDRGLLEREVHLRTKQAGLRAAVMVHLYRAEHGGAWPDDMASLGEIPLDPWSGQPIRYRPPGEAGPACVYSVGDNLVDDGGKCAFPLGMDSEDGNLDVVFPLEPWPAR